MTEARPLLLAGYFGFGNAGDELILRALLDALPFPCEVLHNGPDAPANARPVDRWNPWRVARAIRRCRALLLGGGELFQARTSARSFAYYLALVLAARLLGREVVAYGMGVDPALPASGRRFLRAVLRGARVWARDDATAAVMGNAPPAAVPVAPDPVWAWPVPPVPPVRAPEGTLWILRFAADADAESSFWADLIDAFGKMRPGRTAFLPLHPARDRDGLGRLRARLDTGSVLETWSRPDEIFGVIGRYHAVVTMRYHGLVAACLAGRPCVAVADHGKVELAARDAGVPVLLRREATGGVVAAALDRAAAAHAAVMGRRNFLASAARRGLESLRAALSG